MVTISEYGIKSNMAENRLNTLQDRKANVSQLARANEISQMADIFCAHFQPVSLRLLLKFAAATTARKRSIENASIEYNAQQ